MEEWVGKTWHRWVTRAAEQGHPEAAAELAQVQRALGLLFRAGGGSHALRLAEAQALRHGGPRGWLQRLAGSEQRAAQAQLGPEVLALPARLDVFADPALNRGLYLWLAALSSCWEAGGVDEAGQGGWLAANVRATALALERFPGLAELHERLLDAHLRQRPDPDTMGADAAAERLLRQALQARGRLDALPAAAQSLEPEALAAVWLWLQPAPATAAMPVRKDAPPPTSGSKAAQDRQRRSARRNEDSSSRQGLILMFRAESVLSWSEFVKVNRAGDDDPDSDAAAVANDMRQLDVAEGGETLASRVRFDLDLPSAAADDAPVGLPERLPEWDWKARQLREDYCGLQRFVAARPEPWLPPPALRLLGQRMRRRLEVLRAAPRWQKGLPQGDELDLDAWVRYASETRLQGDRRAAESPPVFQQAQRQDRSLACLLMADLSLSTDACVQGETRVIDVIRDALYVFGEALAGLGDPFEMLGFSSVKRQQVRIQQLKGFEERWGAVPRHRVGAIKPGFYTRMGAALRHATERLAERPERQRLLLLLTDGKPNDLDHYEGRWGLEDTRQAVLAAREAGLSPMCISIDEGPADYLPYLFGQQGFVHLRRPQELVSSLPRLYARLAA
ncbi:nitric oxide reductase activation protein NorD [Roseateles sp. DB2]|uniref:nitric oxide reductase activation protein NorD n=1 Tax=Roseateles sp. DB2 TaxID=3453717 RepID=UPI003EE9144B